MGFPSATAASDHIVPQKSIAFSKSSFCLLAVVSKEGIAAAEKIARTATTAMIGLKIASSWVEILEAGKCSLHSS